jgi:hypothetical protein
VSEDGEEVLAVHLSVAHRRLATTQADHRDPDDNGKRKKVNDYDKNFSQ